MLRREMLAEYFSLCISDAGLVESLPLLLRDYTPNLNNLPSFLMRLGPQVNGHRLIMGHCFVELLAGFCRLNGRWKWSALKLSSENWPTSTLQERLLYLHRDLTTNRLKRKLRGGKYNTSYFRLCDDISLRQSRYWIGTSYKRPVFRTSIRSSSVAKYRLQNYFILFEFYRCQYARVVYAEVLQYVYSIAMVKDI